MKKIVYTSLALLLCILMMLTAVACSKGASADFYDRYDSSANESLKAEDSAEGASPESTGKELTEGRKIIRNVELHLQTKEFTNLLEKLEKEIAELGGYVEESTTNGLDPDSRDHRSARLIVRIPAEKSGSFDSFLSENSVITSRHVTTEDVTLQYVDMESRVKALTLEKEALEEILKKAVNVDEVISVRSQLTNVIHEIEAYQSKLRTYDNLVDYCTVSLFINEVERTAVVEKQTIWQEIGTNLKNNFENVGKGLVSIFVFLVSAIPYLIPVAVIAFVIVLSLKLRKAKNGKKDQKENK